MPKIYISPSSQYANEGLAPFTTEGAEMSLVASAVMLLLAVDGRFLAKCSTPEMTDVYEKARDSNEFGAEVHVAIHSNAGGGEGTEVYAYGAETNSERLAIELYTKIAPLSPGVDRGVKYDTHLIEVGDCVKATSALIELGFHDNALDAAWIADCIQEIATGLYQGICDYFDYDYRDNAVAPIVDHDIYLSVRVRQTKSDDLIKRIIGMGYACKALDLA